jgi:DNA-binding transcriptional ArsR family regulator
MYSSELTSPPSMREFRAHFQALASLTRLRILQHLAGSPQTTVQALADALELSQPRLSWHLRMLRRGHLVDARRSGRVVYCSLNREALHAFQRELSSLVAPRPKVRALNERSEVYLR